MVLLECEDGLNNAHAIQAHLPPGTPLLALPALPPDAGTGATDGGVDAHIAQWLDASAPSFTALAATLRAAHTHRVAELAAAPQRARATLWWPFTQHDDVRDADVTVIDARIGDELIVHDAAAVRWQNTCVGCSGTRSNVG